MAAGKFKVYDFAKLYIGDGTLDLNDAASWKLALFQSTSNCNTLGVGTGVYGDLTDEVANGNGYLTGGADVTGVTYNQAAGVATFDCDNIVWSASGGSISARFAVLYKNATVNSIVKPLYCVCLLDVTPADVTVTDGNTLTIQINLSGITALSGATTD